MKKEIYDNMKRHGCDLSIYAVKDTDAVRIKEDESDIRTPFFRDIDRIIYSLSYTRYIDKTQVFSQNDNDMISKRMTHVQMVSKIARTIGRALKLNEDLIEAISLGHDLGHVPFGHAGEKILDEISLKYNEGHFFHNVQSVRTLMTLEKNGNGQNITLQVLDGILCHNGEFLSGKYIPENKTLKQFLNEYNVCYKDDNVVKNLKPMTLEGCVVRISDVIAYIGKDIEDAIRLKKIIKEDIPKEVGAILGYTNDDIVNNIILDIINSSFGKNYITMSDNVFKSLVKLKNFNYKYIYEKANSKEMLNRYSLMFNKLFEKYIEDLKNKNYSSEIYEVFLNDMNEDYIIESTSERKVIDFIAGMTDDYFIKEYNKYFE